jgi:hypothetical protein
MKPTSGREPPLNFSTTPATAREFADTLEQARPTGGVIARSNGCLNQIERKTKIVCTATHRLGMETV